MRISFRYGAFALCTLVVAAGLSGCSKSHTGAVSVPPYDFVELVPGVYAAMANIGGTAVANAAIVDIGSIAIAFDTGLTPEAGRQMKEAATRLMGKKVGIVINSNFHDDHTGGNQAFEGNTIVSTPETQRIMSSEPTTWPKDVVDGSRKTLAQIQSNLQKVTDEKKHAELTILEGYLSGIVSSSDEYRRVVPTVKWPTRLNFTGRRRAIKIVPAGWGLTEGDAFSVLVKDSVMFASDLVTTDRHPEMKDGNPDGWMAALDTMLTFGFNVLVPGYGPLGDRQSVIRMKDYIQMVDAAADSVLEKGIKPEAVPIDSEFTDWMFASRFYDNVRFVADFRGKQEQ